MTRGLCLAPCQSFFDLNDFALTAGDYLHPTRGKTPHDGDRVACHCNRSLSGRTPPSDSACQAIIARHSRAQYVSHATPTTPLHATATSPTDVRGPPESVAIGQLYVWRGSYRLPGASTPYKRWSKCTMKKIGGEGFCRNLGGKCVNYSCTSPLSFCNKFPLQD